MRGLNSRIAIFFVLVATTPLWADDGVTKLVGNHAQWRYFSDAAKPPDEWRTRSFDDTKWKRGTAGFGYGDSDDRTILSDMRGRYSSVRIRTTFELKKADVETLYLYLKFDDGFVAWINDHRIAFGGLAGKGDRVRVENHEAERYEEFVVENAGRFLKPGMNVIAIEGFNAAVDSTDFSLDPVLSLQRLAQVEPPLEVDEYLADIDEFERRLFDQSSYLMRRDFYARLSLREFRKSIKQQPTMDNFVAGLRKLVMQIGDCHATVLASAWPPSGDYLPLRPADTEHGIVALSLNRDELLDSEYPYIASIDGAPLSDWLQAAAKFAPHGSSQLIRHRSLRWLGRVALMREELGLPAEQIVTLVLRSRDDSQRKSKRLRITQQRYSVASVRMQGSRMLTDNIGYLRIPKMDKRLVESTVRTIKAYQNTDAMIIDVRDNGGGTQHILRAIYGFFVPHDAQPYVNNIAAYRMSDLFSEDHIAYRPTFRADWKGWTEAERTAIQNAASNFHSEWRPPKDEFSDWHYMILSRHRSERDASDFFYYDKPVIILSNAGSFSATDGFLGAFADLPQVTIIGEPSGGGSGAKRSFRLPNSQVTVYLSSMASFRANGKLYEGNGVEVDIKLKPALDDFLSGSDTVLDMAIKKLKRSRHESP